MKIGTPRIFRKLASDTSFISDYWSQ